MENLVVIFEGRGSGFAFSFGAGYGAGNGCGYCEGVDYCDGIANDDDGDGGGIGFVYGELDGARYDSDDE